MISSCRDGTLGAGVVLGTASILSIGPNNLTLAREGLIRGRVGFVATLVFASYLVLLAAVFFLTDTILTGLSPYRSMLTCLGLGAISWFAFLSLRAFVRPSGRQVERNIRSAIRPKRVRRALLIPRRGQTAKALLQAPSIVPHRKAFPWPIRLQIRSAT